MWWKCTYVPKTSYYFEQQLMFVLGTLVRVETIVSQVSIAVMQSTCLCLDLFLKAIASRLSVAHWMCARDFQAGVAVSFQLPCLFFDPQRLPLIGVAIGLLGAISGGSQCTGLLGSPWKHLQRFSLCVLLGQVSLGNDNYVIEWNLVCLQCHAFYKFHNLKFFPK
jgi:hypothetical protein